MPIHAGPKRVARYLPIEAGKWSFGVMECHPLLDDASGLKAVGDLFQIDHLLLQRLPQLFNKNVVEVTTTQGTKVILSVVRVFRKA